VKVGVPREIKTHEYRVGLTPAGARELALHGHSVVVERNAGVGINCGDDAYRIAGALVVDSAEEVFAAAELIIKVKEPQPQEIARLRRGQTLFTYLHLAADDTQTRGLIQSRATCIAYETVTDRTGSLPLLAPMSEVAGRMAVQVGAHCLEREQGGAGILLGGVPGVPPAKVVVLGGGVSGTNAARMAVGLEASVTIIDRSIPRLKELDLQFGPRATTLFATSESIEHAVVAADLVIGAVLVPGAAAPKLVTRSHISRMKKGAVVVDVAIDQGGCFETSHATTHAEPVYMVDGVVHYCVANMPGAVARTSTFALNNATIGHALALAGKGWKAALKDDAHLRKGLNVCEGRVTYEAVARDLGYPYVDPASLLG
jgi:alanine dehydrogenase